MPDQHCLRVELAQCTKTQQPHFLDRTPFSTPQLQLGLCRSLHSKQAIRCPHTSPALIHYQPVVSPSASQEIHTENYSTTQHSWPLQGALPVRHTPLHNRHPRHIAHATGFAPDKACCTLPCAPHTQLDSQPLNATGLALCTHAQHSTT